MKKNNTKVELKKYLSQKEKIKNTFISSCIILVVLTFFIFITYSYFIKNTGEINVGSTYAAASDVVVYNKELVENTNNQKIIITIRNNSSENYSYNLNFEENESCYEVYYDIPNEEYSHSKGIIKSNEEKKIYLISRSGCNINDLDIKVDSGYEYSPVKISNGYKEISYLYKSNSQQEHETDLIDLWADYGELSPSFDTEIYKYDMYIDRNSIESLGGWINEIHFDTNFSNGGYITGEKVQITKEGTIKHEIKVYTNDGKYIQTYVINIHVVETGTGKIKLFKIVDKCAEPDEFGDYPIISTAYKESGFENNDTINFKLPSELNTTACGSPNTINWDLYYELMGDYYTQYDVMVFRYVPGSHGGEFMTSASSEGCVGFAYGSPSSELTYLVMGSIKVYRNGTDELLLKYNIAFS